MAVQIKHDKGMVKLIKDGGNQYRDDPKEYTSVTNELWMNEEEAIHVLGKEHPEVAMCRIYNLTSKRKEIEELEVKLKKLKESL